ncbi:hypothetical protein [Bosea sp. PAMC 26642]|uniref:hypothetical protein n=1 Tax=Bosea sp. (strain PAMC 26642) TaxID=1792307 RepID=UPI0012E7205B|nr:hypothetical protein [Bosea sp. PAMC 26642]
MSAHLTLEEAVFPTGKTVLPAAEPIEAGNSAAWRTSLSSGLLLALRFVQARFLSVWGLLAAAALCPPQVFADFAVYSALANFVSIAALMRFEAVFFQSSDQLRLGRAFRLSLAVGLAFLVAATLAVAAAVASGRILASYGAMFCVSLAGRAVLRLVSAEATAEGDFATIGNCNIVQALVQPAVMVALIWLFEATSLALFAADAIGHLVAAGYLFLRRRRAVGGLVSPKAWSWAELRDSAVRWRTAPLILLPSALLSFGFMVIPLLALPMTSNAVLAAHVALAMRLLEVPTQMFAAVSVPLALSSLRAREGEARQRWARHIALGLFIAAVALFTAIALFALGADFLLDDTQWAEIGQVVAAMAVFYGGIALVAPLHEMASLSQQPHRQVAANAMALGAAMLAVFSFGSLSPALLGTIGLISLARGAAHLRFAWTRLGAELYAAAPRTVG